MQLAPTDWPIEDLESVPDCPVCRSGRRELIYEDLADRQWFCAGGGWRLHCCLDCEAAFLDPRPNRESIGRAYATYYTHTPTQQESESSSANWRTAGRNGYLNAQYGYDFSPASRLGSFLARVLPKKRSYADRSVRNLHRPPSGGRLLDIGCGDGAFLAQMRDAGWEVQGVEPDPDAAARARERGVKVVNRPLEEAPLTPNVFDAATMNHVIEHFHDPSEALRISHRLLKPGGILWIATPNLASRGHALFGEDWVGLDPPRHLVLFSRASLGRLVDSAGFALKGFVSDYSAQLFFPCSATIAAREDPREERTVMRHRNRLSIWLGDLVARFAPERSENIVLIARSGGPR
jgi:SAM-dependent methyltransferase